MKLESHFTLDTSIQHLSNQELAQGILNKISERCGCNLTQLITEDHDAALAQFQKFRLYIVRDVISQFRKNSAGMSREDLGPDIDDKVILASLESTSMELEPNWQFNPLDLEVIRHMQGEEIIEYLRTLTKRFEQITKETDATKVAVSIMGSGLTALTVSAGLQVSKGLFIGWPLKRAVVAGVKSVGVGSVVVAAGLALINFLWWLLTDNPKNMLGLIVNMSEHDLVTKNLGEKDQNLWMNCGDMELFMQDQENLRSPKMQIKGAFADDDCYTESLYFGGIYFANKKFGAYGAEGIFYLTPTSGKGPTIAVMFACPYHSDNGVAMKETTATADLKKEFSELYKNRKVNFASDNSNGIKLQSRINDNRGGVVGNIGIIELPLKL